MMVAQTSPPLLADELTVAVEQTAPAFAVESYRHLHQTNSFALASFNVRFDLALPVQMLEVRGADAKSISQFAGVDYPIAEMPKREPHGDILLQLGNSRRADVDGSTARRWIRECQPACQVCACLDGQWVRVPGSHSGPPQASGPPESGLCLGATAQNPATRNT